MMHKADYIKIAGVLSTLYNNGTITMAQLDTICDNMGNMLKLDNEHFNYVMFREFVIEKCIVRTYP